MKILPIVFLLSGCATTPQYEWHKAGVGKYSQNMDRGDCYIIAVQAVHPVTMYHHNDPMVFEKEKQCMRERGYIGGERLIPPTKLGFD